MPRTTTFIRRTLAAAALALCPSVAGAQICGDADGDSTVSVSDGVQTLRGAASLSSTCGADVCDVDGDGVLTVTDGVNVLRAAASLPALRDCPTEITGFVSGVEGADGTDASLDIGVAPLPGAGAPETISEVEGETNVEGGSSNAVTVTYDTDTAAGAGQIAGGSGQSLIVGVRRLDGTNRRGFFELPLATAAGQFMLILRYPPNLGDEDFLIGFATRNANGVSQVVTLRQHPGAVPTPTRTPTPIPRPTRTPSCGDGTVTPPETCDPPGPIAGGPNCRSDCTFCGDGVRNGQGQAQEECDGNPTNDCGGLRCLGNCTCDQLQ